MRIAQVAITPDVLAEAVSVLRDAGVEILGSLDSAPDQRLVNLVIAGEALPDACETMLNGLPRPVIVTFHAQTYGSQRITRVESIRQAQVARRFPV